MQRCVWLLTCGMMAWMAAILAPASNLAAADWPQWQGPNRTGVSPETGLLREWPAAGPKQLWLFRQTGLGYSGPAVAGGKLFVMGARGDTEFLLALDARTGRELWAARIDRVLRNGWGDGPRGTPAVDGDTVYALGGQGTLVAVAAADGRVLWHHTMQEYGGSTPNWGYAESVLVDGDKVLCTPGGSKGAVVALNKRTGARLWQSAEFKDDAHYSSLMPAEFSGTRQYVQLTERSVAGVAAADGRLLWRSDFPGRTAVIPTPIVRGDAVYVTAGYGAGCKQVRVGPEGKAAEVYSNKVMKNHHGGVVLVGDHLYGHSDGSGWLCQEFATGAEVWSERQRLGKGAVASAEGMLYCVSEDQGVVVLAEASPAGWKEHGRFTLEPQSRQRSSRGKLWTHPVIADGRLYLRDQELLFCFDIKQ